MEKARVVFDEVGDEKHKPCLSVVLPMTSPSGKVRVKNRSFFAEYGEPVAVRQVPLTNRSYVEWQIGYDLEATQENKTNSSLSDFQFIDYKGRNKISYELSEILYYSFKLNLVSIDEIRKLKYEIENIPDRMLLDTIDSMRILRTNPIEIDINKMHFYEMKVMYPLIVHRFRQYDIFTEIITKEKQRAIGVQPML